MKIPIAFKLATVEQSQKIDADTTRKFDIDSFTLMEMAGSSAAKMLLNRLEPESRGIFLCGKGNNGGDALVVARYLIQHCIRVTLVFISGKDNLSPDAEKNYTLLQAICENNAGTEIDFISSWKEFDQSVKPDFIVDGMLGTGLNNDLRGDYANAVQWTNRTSCPVFAMDIPTGLHADSGQIMGNAVKAAQTFAFGTRKQGFYLGQGPEYTGSVAFCELPFPHHLMSGISTYLMNKKWLPHPSPTPARHKYEAGVVHIIAGSEGLTGAAIMTAKSAWAEGVGAVILVCPRGVLPIFENNLPQIIKKPIGHEDDVYFKKEHYQEACGIVTEKDGPVLLGPGMGRQETTVHFVTSFLAQTEQKVIIDADGLWALSQQEEWEKPQNACWTLTPHPGELATLLNAEVENDIQRFQQVKEVAQQKDITLLSKGFPVILGTSEGDTYVSEYDTRIFSRAGFGDILAGKIAAFNAREYSPAVSCIKALLIGREKAETIINQKNNYLEPFDLI